MPRPIVDGAAPPEEFEIARNLSPGRYPLLDVFQGLDRVPAFRKYPGPARRRDTLAHRSFVEIVPRRGEWMYVAPHEMPPDADARWKPIISADDCIVVARSHLRKSPSMVLYLDVLHELYHVVQRRSGRELWDDRYSYVDRPTEVQAYRFAVREARRLGASDAFLREYLRVEWTTPKEHRRLLRNVGISLG
jgi:hypothetical protein